MCSSSDVSDRYPVDLILVTRSSNPTACSLLHPWIRRMIFLFLFPARTLSERKPWAIHNVFPTIKVSSYSKTGKRPYKPQSQPASFIKAATGHIIRLRIPQFPFSEEEEKKEVACRIRLISAKNRNSEEETCKAYVCPTHKREKLF